MDKYGSDLDTCYSCERTLNDYEEIYCGPCQSKLLAEWEPTDADLARRDAMITRGWAHLAAMIAGVTVGLLVLVAGLALFTRDVQAQDAELRRNVGGVEHTWTPPEAGCVVVRAWEDHSSIVQCPSGTYAYDPDGSIDRGVGWYSVNATR